MLGRGYWFIIAFLLFTLLSQPALSMEQLSVMVNLDKEVYGFDERVTIYGVVVDSTGLAVDNAVVSIQVENPGGKAFHMAMVVSDGAGNFTDQFLIPSDAEEGSYTVYVTASKPGYSVGKGQAFYTVIPEIVSSTRLLALIAVLVSFLLAGRKIRGKK